MKNKYNSIDMRKNNDKGDIMIATGVASVIFFFMSEFVDHTFYPVFMASLGVFLYNLLFKK